MNTHKKWSKEKLAVTAQHNAMCTPTMSEKSISESTDQLNEITI